MPRRIAPAICGTRGVVTMAKRMFEAQKLEKWLWAEAVANAVYTLNQCLTKALQSITLEEMWRSRRPYVVHMRVFGSLAYAIVSDEKWSNLDAKAIKCMFLGYCEGMKGFYR